MGQRVIRVCWILFVFMFLVREGVLAQSIYTPKYSNEFLEIGVNSKNIALGGAAVSNVSDVNSGYWNPAGLVGIPYKHEISAMHNEYFGGVAQYNFIAGSIPVDSGSRLALSYVRLSVDNIPDTRFLFDNDGNGNSNSYGPINYNKLKFFSSADNAFYISYGKQSRKVGKAKVMGMYRYGANTYMIDSAGSNLSYGGSLKIIKRTVGDFAQAWGFGLDLGAQYKWKGLAIGVTFKDVSSTFNFWSINGKMLKNAYDKSNSLDTTKINTLPGNTLEITLPKLILGMSRYLYISKSKKIGLCPMLDLVATFDGRRNVLLRSKLISLDPRVGIEFDYKKVLYFRAGLNNFQKLKDFDGSFYYTIQPSFGIGLQFSRFSVDYAMVNPGNVSVGLNSHVFSLKLGLNDIKK